MYEPTTIDELEAYEDHMDYLERIGQDPRESTSNLSTGATDPFNGTESMYAPMLKMLEDLKAGKYDKAEITKEKDNDD